MTCPDCGKVAGAYEVTCLTCGCFVGFPNVRAADSPEEVVALEARYHAIRSTATAEGRLLAVDAFEERLKASFAVMNTKLADLHAFLANPKALYSTYSLSVKGQVRMPADPDHDQERRMVEARLFGAYGEEIRYAALSLNGAGLDSYGPVTIRLRDVAVEKRSSLLEENSFDFVDRHRLLPKIPVPKGYRCAWRNRHVLGVAKLAHSVRSGDGNGQFEKLLLHSNGNRSADDFIEVHIYGPFNADSIENVRGKTPSTGKQAQAEVARVKELLAQRGCSWIEDA